MRVSEDALQSVQRLLGNGDVSRGFKFREGQRTLGIPIAVGLLRSDLVLDIFVRDDPAAFQVDQE